MSQKTIEEVRQIVQRTSSDFKFDERELERVAQDDNFVLMFVMFYDEDVNTSAEAIVECLKWRKKHDVVNLNASQLPAELFTTGRQRMGRSKNGRPYIVDRTGLHRKCAKFNEVRLLFMCYILEHHVKEQTGDLYLDVSDGGLTSVDLTMSRASTELFKVCYPGKIERVYLYGIPNVLLPVTRTLVKVLPKKFYERVHFISKEKAIEQMDAQSWLSPPEGLSTLAEVCPQRGFTESETRQLQEYYDWVKEKCAN